MIHPPVFRLDIRLAKDLKTTFELNCGKDLRTYGKEPDVYEKEFITGHNATLSYLVLSLNFTKQLTNTKK